MALRAESHGVHSALVSALLKAVNRGCATAGGWREGALLETRLGPSPEGVFYVLPHTGETNSLLADRMTEEFLSYEHPSDPRDDR